MKPRVFISILIQPKYESHHVNKWVVVEHGRNHLITNQRCKLLTCTRETTNDGDGSQGTTVQSVKVIMNLRLNTHGIIQSKATNEELLLDAKNWPLRHVNSKVLKGSF